MNCPLTIRTEQCVGSYYVIVADNGRWLFKDGPYLHVTTAMDAGRAWAREYALAILRAIGPDMPYKASNEGDACMDMANGQDVSYRPCGGVHAV